MPLPCSSSARWTRVICSPAAENGTAAWNGPPGGRTAARALCPDPENSSTTSPRVPAAKLDLVVVRELASHDGLGGAERATPRLGGGADLRPGKVDPADDRGASRVEDDVGGPTAVVPTAESGAPGGGTAPTTPVVASTAPPLIHAAAIAPSGATATTVFDAAPEEMGAPALNSPRADRVASRAAPSLNVIAASPRAFCATSGRPPPVPPMQAASDNGT